MPLSFYSRYAITTKLAPPIKALPNRFLVKVKRWQLAKLLLKELFHYRGKWKVISSRPCVYGVFSGPIGGFAPREKLCVGCLRCTTQYPKVVQIFHNPKWHVRGDDFFTAEHIDHILSQAKTGRIPIKGAGYRGVFGGNDWDGMWTDMSEIVRPTRDGIHGREYISTEVDIGIKPPFLQNVEIKNVTIPLPFVFDGSFSNSPLFHKITVKAAEDLQTLVFLNAEILEKSSLYCSSVIPLFHSQDRLRIKKEFPLVAMEEWDELLHERIKIQFPNSLILLKTPFESPFLLEAFRKGVRLFYLVSDEKGRTESGKFMMEAISAVNALFTKAQCREEVTLIGGGGIVAAEHIAKAILCGLDLVAIQKPLLVALQDLPLKSTVEWGAQRIKNLSNAWRDQLLEIMGAMGIRDIRRMRGERGRAMFQKELEKEAFSEIRGYQ